MSHIFISYSRKNQTYARALADELLRRGFDVWIDDQIDYGDRWQKVIFKAIDDCAAIIILMTPDSLESEWVEREYNYAHKRKKPQFPVLLEGEEFPFYVTAHFVDVRNGNLPKDDFFVKLQRIIKPKGSRGEEITVQIPVERKFPLILKPDWVGKIIPAPFEWCVIPAGVVTLELSGYDGDYLTQQQTFDVPEFQIARYPITNAQFEVFVTAKDGWRDPQWWNYSDTAKAWRAQKPQSEAADFKDCADCPRETVTWYAAVAFTRWLSAKTGEKITLPAEQQWQRAAQGDDGREYPWGNTWDASKCNSSESGIGKTTPVTQYPQGASPYGAIDMSGNVWEWCLTEFQTGQIDLNGTNVRVLRGGSWLNYPQFARAARRGNLYPNDRLNGIGFRVVLGSPPT